MFPRAWEGRWGFLFPTSQALQLTKAFCLDVRKRLGFWSIFKNTMLVYLAAFRPAVLAASWCWNFLRSRTVFPLFIRPTSLSWASCVLWARGSSEADRQPCPCQGLTAWLERHTSNENYTNKDSHSTNSPHLSTVSSTELGTWWVLFQEYVTNVLWNVQKDWLAEFILALGVQLLDLWSERKKWQWSRMIWVLVPAFPWTTRIVLGESLNLGLSFLICRIICKWPGIVTCLPSEVF